MEKRPEPPFEGGAQRIVERPTEVPKDGRNVAQYLVVGLGILVMVAALLWILVPLGG